MYAEKVSQRGRRIMEESMWMRQPEEKRLRVPKRVTSEYGLGQTL